MRPMQHVIAGVPFVSFAEARQWDSPDKDTVNPSFVAAQSMVLRYWGEDWRTAPAWWTDGQPVSLQTLDNLKDVVAQDVPVLVSAGLTPVGHLTITEYLAMKSGIPEIAEVCRRIGPHSAIIGTVLPYTAFAVAGDQTGQTIPLRETLLLSCRVVIGYDDGKQTIVLHDPSFGPAWEIGQQDFEAMWTPFGQWGALHTIPPDSSARLARRPPARPDPIRTVEQKAAEHFAFGYALACVGRIDEARRRYEQGLSLPAPSRGYRHLFLVELALLTRNRDTAIALLQKAVAAAPEHPRAWRLLAHLYWLSRTLRGRARAIWALIQGSRKRRQAARPGSRTWVPQEMLFFPFDAEIPPSADYLKWAGPVPTMGLLTGGW